MGYISIIFFFFIIVDLVKIINFEIYMFIQIKILNYVLNKKETKIGEKKNKTKIDK